MLEDKADQIIEYYGASVETDAPLIEALKIFDNTKLGLVPITKEGCAVATLLIRDILPLITECQIDDPVSSISSSLTSGSKTMTIREALKVMLKNSIRRIAILSQVHKLCLCFLRNLCVLSTSSSIL
jgi:predicted transcriptional regulator